MKDEVQRIALEAIRSGVYKKNIHFLYGPKFSGQEFDIVSKLGGSPGVAAWIMQKAHYKVGIQIQVSKDVTDDLLATDFSEASHIADIPWPAPVVEIYFEDPQLPTVMVMKTTPQELMKWYPQLDVALKEPEYLNALMQEGSDVMTAKQLSLQLCPRMYDDFLQNGTTEKMTTGPLSSNLDARDNATMCFMLTLALKVFTFASIPQYKPVPITKKQMHYGGKPNVQSRPAKPSFRVSYLPKIIHVRKNVGGVDENEREFHGRRGYLRYFFHERFTTMRGKWIFIQPVVDPATGKYPPRSIIKVRKP